MQVANAGHELDKLSGAVRCNQLSHRKKGPAPGWLGYIGDEILPSYIGIIS